MPKCHLNINGKVIVARRGDTLLDAALGAGVFVPLDCCSGQCETCRVRVAWGAVDDKGTAYGDTVLACQAVLMGDTTITFDEVSPPRTVKGRISAIKLLSSDVFEVALDLAEPLTLRPGQYVSVRFAGFPARDYSPTARLNGELGASEVVLNVKRLPGGVVSGQIGRDIGINHRVRIRGPLGSAFLREPPSGLLVMTSTGTGWAPIWSMARAACLSRKRSDICIIVGARDPENLYMAPALDWLRQMDVAEIILTARTHATGSVRFGTPDKFLPPLTIKDVVHVAGGPGLVDAIKERALIGEARCYADPFTPSRNLPSIPDRLAGLVRAVRRSSKLALSG